ncbi:isoflavone reductase P3 [Fusarium mundagurra]|uniref:Isoflavone reductase P3 n=1 Tax=Fusarium mundagurra TaxID=1567541 RepID=A0A8H5Z561_9HYPO|nr:isoflavone reductase P3 [Fusarium mundagurra]
MKVAILGATGETGTSILNALLDSTEPQYEITALVRQSSLEKPEALALKEKGIKVVAADLSGPEDELARVLDGIDTVISAISAVDLLLQIPLINAAQAAGVQRFLPCCYAPIMPPAGILGLRDTAKKKERVINHVKKVKLPYTIVDIGYWYQLMLPRLPSGRIDYALTITLGDIPGDGNTPCAFTDLPDIGRWVARIIADPRTLNKMVFAYNTVLTMNQAYDVLEEASSEKTERNYISEAAIMEGVARAEANCPPADSFDYFEVVKYQYFNALGIHATELYPDMKVTTPEAYCERLLSGKATMIYQRLMPAAQRAMKSVKSMLKAENFTTPYLQLLRATTVGIGNSSYNARPASNMSTHITVLPASTKVGKETIRILLASPANFTIRGIYRDTSKAPDEYTSYPNFSSVKGDVASEESLDFSHSDAVLYVPPPTYENIDQSEWAKKTANNVKDALKKSAVKRLVVLSGLGSQNDHGIGFVRLNHHTDKILKDSVPEVTILQSTHFQEEFEYMFQMPLGDPPTISSWIAPRDFKIPIVSLRDVGEVCAKNLLSKLESSSPQVLKIFGPRTYSSIDLRDMFEEITGNKVELGLAQGEDLKAFFRQILPEHCIADFMEMIESSLPGGLIAKEYEADENTVTGKVDMLEVFRELGNKYGCSK